MVGLGSSGRSLAAPVVAPGWELNTLFEGGVGVQLPLAVAVRQWGPTGDLIVDEQVDYPVIESGGDGLVRAAWYDKQSAGSDRQPVVRYKVCDGTAQSCHQESHWTDGAGPIVGLGWFTDVERVELGLDTGGSGTGLQAALLMAKAAGSDPYRVYFRCRRSESEAWRPPVKLLEPDGAWSFLSQSLEYGRPHLVVDRQGDTVHAVGVQRGRVSAGSPWHSEVVWLRGAIDSVCPLE